MLNSFHLRTKIFFLVTIAVVIAFAILTTIVSNRTFDLAVNDAFKLADETADKYQNAIRAELQGARITAETLATVVATLKDFNITDRAVINGLLKSSLAKKEYITAFCTAFDPNALDGKDDQFKNKTVDGKDPAEGETAAYDENGRYAPYWNKLGANIAVEPLAVIDTEDWYIVPKRDLTEFITNPYPYDLQGQTILLESLVFPVIHDGKFLGIISSDIVLDKLQEMVTKVNPHNQGGYSEIFSNNGCTAAHPNKELLCKDIAEGQVYKMLTLDRRTVANAIELADNYLEKNPVQDKENEEEVKKFSDAKEFADGLKLYGKDFDESHIHLPLLNPDLAWEILKADEKRCQHTQKAKKCIETGKSFVYTDDHFYTIYVPIHFSDVTAPWSVTVSIPMAKVLQEAHGIRNYVMTVAAVSAGGIGLVLYLLAGSIVRPIRKLADTAKILGSGKFDAQVPRIDSKDEIGELSAAFTFMTNEINKLIKELQANAKALEEKNVYLKRLNELKDEFLANTSHELRTPINGIIGIVESMIDGAIGELTDEQKYNLMIASNSGKRLSNMVNDILDLSKLKNQEIQLQLKAVDLKVIAGTVITLTKPLIKGKNLVLINEIDEQLPLIEADENRIQQILYNLLGNAIKFTEKGEVRIFANVVNGKVAISVKDTGIGIPEDKFDKIFESFEQADGSTSREYGGTGLGLSITKKLVELHGGVIAVESRVGEGSTFMFTVRKSDATTTDADITDEEMKRSVIDMESFIEKEMEIGFDSSIIRPGATRILVVDDEPVNIQVLSNLLSVRNFTVIKAYNGLEAINLFEKGETFDLVLLDVMMPKMSGYDVCRHLRNKYSPSELPIIMLTAKNQVQDIVYGFQAGANDYVHKPFDKDELLVRIKTLLELKEAMHAATAANDAKSQFLANMSHELRTPLNAVIGLTALLLKTQMDETQRDYTEKMNQASASLLGIINNILDFSSVDAGRMKLERAEFDIRKMLSNLTDDFERQYAGSVVSLNVELDSAVPKSLIGDQLRLRQVFINLIDNGYKFTERGSISIKGIVMRSDPSNAMMKFSVTDTGIGMDEKTLDVVFAAFNQADNSATRRYGGTGIGLTITREIVELMGGTITVVSRLGQGTTFTFTCPFQISEGVAVQTTKGEESGIKPEKPDNQNDVLKGMRVLLVEDNKINAMIAMELLRSVGVDVVLAKNGQEAIDQFAEAVQVRGVPAFDLVLMDLQMPMMDGYEATKIIKSTPEYKDTPIYALTAHAFAEERERCRALGMQGHLTKPIDVEKFYEALRKAITK